ncbi:MAG: ABC transporter permease, partial [Myxococcota bacterium]|nr:ABC transporter permease [Myxococcota bacterium]
LGLVLVPGVPLRLIADTSLAEGRTARLLVLEALARRDGPSLHPAVSEEPVRATRARYIDFLIPGLIAFTLMNASMFGLGFGVVNMRIGKMLKRLTATSMRKPTFLGTMLLTRGFQVLLEVGFLVLLALVLFDVKVAGNYLALLAFSMLGAFCFSGVGLLAGSRTRNAETAGGIFNLITVPMGLVSGIFFSTSNFPDWLQPLVRCLPLAALADGLRGIMVDGVTLGSLTFAMAVLLAWGGVTFVVAVKVLRWE